MTGALDDALIRFRRRSVKLFQTLFSAKYLPRLGLAFPSHASTVTRSPIDYNSQSSTGGWVELKKVFALDQSQNLNLKILILKSKSVVPMDGLTRP